MAVFDKAKRKVKEIASIKKLNSDLKKLGSFPAFNATKNKAVYEYAVNFFNIVLDFQDSGLFVADDFKKNKKEITGLLAHISRCGRNPYGLVRAPEGKKLSLNTLFLGNVGGLWTKSADNFAESPDPEVQAIIYKQIKDFIDSHYTNMLKLSNKILETESLNMVQKLVAKSSRTK